MGKFLEILKLFDFYHFRGSVVLFLIEFLTLCLPPLLIHTLFGNNVVLATVFLLTICFLLSNSARELRALRTSICRDFKLVLELLDFNILMNLELLFWSAHV